MWSKIMNKVCILLLLIIMNLCIQHTARAEDRFVSFAKSLNANDYDKMLPAQPVGQWLKAHLPDNYKAVWASRITDCGEGIGGPSDRERDMPLCAEIEISTGDKSKGALMLFVGTERLGMLREGAGVYFGYVEYGDAVFNIRNLGDLLKIR
jgi:hypothetical protein